MKIYLFIKKKIFRINTEWTIPNWFIPIKMIFFPIYCIKSIQVYGMFTQNKIR